MDKIYQSNPKNRRDVDIETSKLDILKLRFKLTKEGEEDVLIEKKLFFPRLIDNQFFIINGNRYFPIFQLVDSGTYRTNKTVTLKTLLMSVVCRDDRGIVVEDMDGNKYSSRVINIDIFKNKINVFIYYYAKFGFEKALEYFRLNTKVIIGNQPIEGKINFGITKNIVMSVNKEFMENENDIALIVTLIKSLPNRITEVKLYEQEYWVKRLGSNFTKNNSNFQDKGNSILLSFERLLDETTKRNQRLPDSEKSDIYAIMRWMSSNFVTLYKQDNMDLANKRLRLYEYLIYPLSIKFSKSMYRILNSRNVTMEQLKSIFSNIPEGFLVKKLVNNELIRYNNSVNSIDLFSSILKATQSGPQSQLSGGNNINIRYRGIHPSYINNIDLCATSAGDPGISFSLTPFVKLEDNMHFTKKASYSSFSDIRYEDDGDIDGI